MNRYRISTWIIAIAAFISIAAYMIVWGIPMYIIGVIMLWTSKAHIIDKISWTVLPVVAFYVLALIVYSYGH